MRKFGVLFVLTVLAVTLVCGMASAATDLKGKEVVVYIAFGENEGKAMLEAFEKETGCKFLFVRMPAGEIVARVQAEKASPQADLILGGAAENHEVLKAQGLLEKYLPKDAAKDIPEYYRDQDEFWTGFYVGPLAIGVNKDYWDKEFAPKGIESPKSFEDLLNPAFKGEIVMPDPSTSGTGYTLIASLVQSDGDQKAFDFLKKFRPQVAQFPGSGLKPAQMVGSGEYLICVNFLHDQLMLKKQGMPIVSVVPEGAGWEIGATSIIKGGPNPEAAKALADFVVGKTAGDIHSQMTSRLSTRADVPVPEGAVELSKMPINKDYSFHKASEQRKNLVNKWKDTE